jgi:hypothetical protein
VAPRNPLRAKASDIGDEEALDACATWTTVGAPFPSDRFLARFPAKVVAMKLAKLHRRGWTDHRHYLTKEGRAALEKFEQEGASE